MTQLSLTGGGQSSGNSVARTAYVETTGNDATGTVGNIALPFATANGALDAIMEMRFNPVTNWFDVTGKTCVLAYQPYHAASYAASLSNLAQPGTYDAFAGNAPSWDAATGWTGNGTNQYLRTGFTPTAQGTVLVWMSGTYNSNGVPVGSDTLTGTAAVVGFIPRWSSNKVVYWNGGTLTGGTSAIPCGNHTLVSAGTAAYCDGVLETGSISAWNGTTRELWICALNNGAGTLWFSGNVLAVAYWDDVLSSSEVAAVLDKLLATSRYTVALGSGTFAAITGDDSGYSSKLYKNITFRGAGQPSIKADHTGLENGTIIKGPLVCDRDGMEFYDLGVDSGSAVVNADYGGTAQEGLMACTNVGSVVGKATRTGVIAKRISAICKDAASPVHAFIIENVTSAVIEDIAVCYGTHGIVIKGISTTGARLSAAGNSHNSIIIKSNAYAPCHDVTVTDVTAACVAPGDTLCAVKFTNADAGSPSLSDCSVDDVLATGTTNGVIFTGIAAGVEYVERCVVTNLTGVTSAFKSGNVQDCSVNGVPV